jgi:hypothetical protein
MRWRGSADPDRGEPAVSHDSRFEWRFRGERFGIDVSVPAYLYRYYDDRWRTREFGTYVVDPFHDDIVAAVADGIESRVRDRGYGDRAVTECAVRFAQSIPYEQDIVTTGQPEYPQFPVETLHYEQGDCEDLSILLGALLRELGHDVAVLALPTRSHMCLGVDIGWAEGAHVTHDGVDYYVVESTSPGWSIGEVPPQYRGASIRPHPVDDVPLLLHQWEAVENGDGTAEVEGSLVNYGTGSAEDVSVVAWFEAPNGRIARTTVLDTEAEVLPRTSVSFAGRVPLPQAGRLRGHLQLRLDGGVHDQTASDWE